MALKSMSIEKLVALKGQVEAMLSSKVLEQRRTLESELSKLGRFQGGNGRAKSVSGRGGARGAVAPKYRNPENPAVANRLPNYIRLAASIALIRHGLSGRCRK
jgi:hypothetical protein